MLATEPRTRIGLSRWYAGLRLGPAMGEAPLRGATVPLRRVGPFDIARPEEGADIAVFGSPHQPSVALFDGFLFDRRATCDELHLAHTARHAEILAAAFERWGRSLFTRLAGNYLAALWDGAARRLVLGHDRLGRHPVFFANTSDMFWFSSNVLELGRSGVVDPRPNRMSIAMTAFALWPEAGETFFADIRRLGIGQYLEVALDGSTRDVTYWDPYPVDEHDWLTEREVVEEFEPKLLRAVSRCMELEPEGIMLSGGVDSVTIAALAMRERRAAGGRPLIAVSGRADVPLHHEEDMQKVAADALGMPQLVSRTSEWNGNREDVSLSLDVTPDLPGPGRVCWVGTYMAFYRWSAANNVRVLLTGSGGDNWLAVADHHAADLIRRFKLRELSGFFEAASRTGGWTKQVAGRRLLWEGGFRLLIDSVAAKLLPGPKARFHRRRADGLAPPWLCPDTQFRSEFLDRLMERRVPALDAAGRMPRNYYHHQMRAANNPHLFHEFEVAFHVDAMCGLRLLSPYHDPDLVHFFTRIPPPVLVRGNKYKGLLRPVVDKHLPGHGFGNQRKDYPRAAADSDLQKLRAGILQQWPRFQFEHIAGLGVVDPGAVKREVERVPTYPMLPLVRMFAVMSAETWLGGRRA
jgi:asparagine synthetase B (glutamine-hydrolysing)